MVGRCAVLFRLLDASSGLKFVPPKTAVPEEQTIQRLILDSQFVILGQQELGQPCPLKIHNTDPENMRIYQALFSDTDVLPWKSGKNSTD